jgi:hypothetical protein
MQVRAHNRHRTVSLKSTNMHYNGTMQALTYGINMRIQAALLWFYFK